MGRGRRGRDRMVVWLL